MSQLEDLLAFQLKAGKIPFEREVSKLVPGRRFRVDFLVEGWLVVEVQGGLHMAKSGHNTFAGISRDTEKAALLLIEGYQVLAVTGAQIKAGTALQWIEKLREV